MDAKAQAESEATEIVARIMTEMEDVIGLIQRPSRRASASPSADGPAPVGDIRVPQAEDAA